MILQLLTFTEYFYNINTNPL